MSAKKVYLFNLKKVEHLPFSVLFKERGAHKVGQMDRRREEQEIKLICVYKSGRVYIWLLYSGEYKINCMSLLIISMAEAAETLHIITLKRLLVQ